MNKDERQIIYEIYRACRLCGAGAGYKMPIIQSVIDVDMEETELKEKIWECVQLEVKLNDRMPPLICELCANKINDFYEFRTMCRENNRKTRLRLGLPLQALSVVKATPEVQDSILGVTHPMYINSDSDEGQPLAKQTTTARTKPRHRPVNIARETNVKMKNSVYQSTFKEEPRSLTPEFTERREVRLKGVSSPKRNTRQSRSDEGSLSDLQGVQILSKPPPRVRPVPKSVLMKKMERLETDSSRSIEEESDDDRNSLNRKPKRLLEKELAGLGIELPQPAKKAKLAPEPPKPGKPKPGPKSSKVAPNATPPAPKATPSTPKAGPKSKKSETLAVPKSKKSEQTPVPTQKSRKKDPTPPPVPTKSKRKELSPVPNQRFGKSETAPGPKSRKSEVKVAPVAKSKKRETSPASTSKPKKPGSTPASKPKRDLYAKAVDRASPQPEKSCDCNICGLKAKSPQGLAAHKKCHLPEFTPIKQSCNACELWFVTAEEASRHHKGHTEKGMPYTCGRCYDDFGTAAEYELHFTRNLCLSTYEVPDVKCDECWHYFPTYKLLEDHKCPGEGGRPGGKCNKCRRSYALLKTLTAHEIRCNVKKKEPEVKVQSYPIVDPAVAKRLLPMQVRISRCDSLLKSPDDRCIVSGVSHRFGLDRNYSYPYLYSMGDVRVKTEYSIDSFDHMVAIKDEIKEEYLNSDDSFVHWDTDSSDSDDDTCGASFGSSKVDSLARISLKTIFSPKCLGKVAKRKRKFKSEKGFESVLSIDFPADIKRSIDSIIDNLGNDHSDNESDSVLNKNLVHNKEGEVHSFDKLRANSTDNLASETKAEVAKDENESHTKDIEVHTNDSSSIGNTNEENVETAQNGNNGKNTDNDQTEQIDNNTKRDVNTQPNETIESNALESHAFDTPKNKLASRSIPAENLVSQNNNENYYKDESKIVPEVLEKTIGDKEPTPAEDKVEISSSRTLEKMDIDEVKETSASSDSTEVEMSELAKEKLDENKTNMSTIERMDIDDAKEPKSANDANINSASTDNEEVEKQRSLLNDTNITDAGTETEDSQSSDAISYKEHTEKGSLSADMHDSKSFDATKDNFNVEKDDSQSSEAINFTAVDSFNGEKDDSQSSDAVNFEAIDINGEKNDTRSSDGIDYRAIENHNAERDNLQTDVTNDTSSHSESPRLELNNTEDYDVAKSEYDTMLSKNEAIANPISNQNVTMQDELNDKVQCVVKTNLI